MLRSYRCHEVIAAKVNKNFAEAKMQGAKGKIEILGCFTLVVLVYGMFLLSVMEPYRPDVLAWFRGDAGTPGTAKEVRFAER